MEGGGLIRIGVLIRRGASTGRRTLNRMITYLKLTLYDCISVKKIMVTE